MVDLYIHWHWSSDDCPQWQITVDGIQQTVLNIDLLKGRVGHKKPFTPEEWREALEGALRDYKPRVQEALTARDVYDAEKQEAKMKKESDSRRLAALATEIASMIKETPPLCD